MAAYRALETAKPARERLFSDPYAIRFLPHRHRWLVRLSRVPALRRRVERYADGLAPGARTSAIARTRLIDDWLRAEVAAGARQLVILGAGFDCRALRLPELGSLDVFELDRPAMIAFKSRLLDDLAHPRLRRLPIDFLRDRLADRLLAAGFASNTRAVFLWEGVTNYLDARSVAAVFDFVAGTARPGSKLVFTYVDAAAVAGRFEAPGLAALLASLEKRGEPWSFGFVPEELPTRLASHGLRLVADLDAAHYRRRYWPSFPEARVGYEFYHVALAEIPPAPSAPG